MSATTSFFDTLELRLFGHRRKIDELKSKCAALGAPEFMCDFFQIMSHKTGFSIEHGASALLQPFSSGKITKEDSVQIAESTNFLLNVAPDTSLSQYCNLIDDLYEKLK